MYPSFSTQPNDVEVDLSISAALLQYSYAAEILLQGVRSTGRDPF